MQWPGDKPQQEPKARAGQYEGNATNPAIHKTWKEVSKRGLRLEPQQERKAGACFQNYCNYLNNWYYSIFVRTT